MRSPITPAVLQCVLEVAESGSIRRAAERLFVSPSSVNRQILQLEERIGTPLFEREARGMRLTRSGEIILAAAREFDRSVKEALDQVGALKELGGGSVSFGTLTTFAETFVAPLILDLRSKHKGLRISYYGGNSADIVHKVLEGDLDFGLCWEPPLSTPVRRLDSVLVPVGVAVRPGHPLAGRTGIRLRDCLRHSVVFPSRGMEFRSVLDRINLGLGNVISPSVEANSIPALRRLCVLGDQPVMMTANAVIDELESGALLFRPLTDSGCGHLKACLFERDDAPATPGRNELESALRAEVADLRSKLAGLFPELLRQRPAAPRAGEG